MVHLPKHQFRQPSVCHA